jgi:hypothetical protein
MVWSRRQFLLTSGAALAVAGCTGTGAGCTTGCAGCTTGCTGSGFGGVGCGGVCSTGWAATVTLMLPPSTPRAGASFAMKSPPGPATSSNTFTASSAVRFEA